MKNIDEEIIAVEESIEQEAKLIENLQKEIDLIAKTAELKIEALKLEKSNHYAKIEELKAESERLVKLL